MSHFILISGSPSDHSRSDVVLRYLGQQLPGEATHVSVRDIPAADLCEARFDSLPIQRLQTLIKQADGVVIASPVYKAAYSGVLKALLDLLPPDAFQNKPVLPLMTGGSANHLLALEYSFKPLLSALKANTLKGVYLVDHHIDKKNQDAPVTDPALLERLHQQTKQFIAAVELKKVLL